MFNWKILKESHQLDTLLEASAFRTQLIFKHSIRCGISTAVLRQFEKKYATDFDAIDFYYLDLITHRALSNEISQRFNLVHQSPQVLVIKNNKMIAHDSHYGILDLDF